MRHGQPDKLELTASKLPVICLRHVLSFTVSLRHERIMHANQRMSKKKAHKLDM